PATGQPPAGGVPAGTSIAKPSRAAVRARGVCLVGTGGMTVWRVTNCGDRYEPNAYQPTVPASTRSGTALDDNGFFGSAKAWSLRFMPNFATVSPAKTVVRLPCLHDSPRRLAVMPACAYALPLSSARRMWSSCHVAVIVVNPTCTDSAIGCPRRSWTPRVTYSVQ